METDPMKLREIILNQPTVSYEQKLRETREVLEADAMWRRNMKNKSPDLVSSPEPTLVVSEGP